VRNQVSYPYKTTAKITALQIEQQWKYAVKIYLYKDDSLESAIGRKME
jgi:hypothetical protein